MKKIEINLLHLDIHDHNAQISARPAQRIRALLSIALCSAAILAATSVLSYQQSKNSSSPLNTTIQKLFSGQLYHFWQTQDKTLRGEYSDRINILLMGVGGNGHDGPMLSDTNIIVSIRPSQKRAALISIPRDLVVPMEGYGWRKINNANAFGEMQNPEHGGEFARNVFQTIFSLPIDYFIRVDFRGFEKIVDLLDGITVTVDQAFTDYSFPTLDYKYRPVHFDAGEQRMNGVRALEFARSRHSPMNNEGSDFARSKRQQKVLLAVREKLLSPEFILNPKKISHALSTFTDYVQANIQGWEWLKFATLLQSLKKDGLIHFVFDDSPNGYLVPDAVDGAFVLRPKDGTFDAMREKLRTIFDEEPALKEKEKIIQESPIVSVKNGTLIEGLASKFSTQLSIYGFTILEIGNNTTRDHTQSLLYDFTHGTKPQSRDVLVRKFAVKPRQPTPQYILEYEGKTIDFLLILGATAEQHLTQ